MTKVGLEGALRAIVAGIKRLLSVPLIALLVALAIVWRLGGWHIVYAPTADQLFGCAHTYINAAGEDTGECE